MAELDALGLSGIEQATYERLVGAQPHTVDELAFAVHATAEQLRVTLESLEAYGLVGRLPGAPTRYTAMAPEVALEVLCLDRERQIQQARAYARRLAARFNAPAAERDPAELIEVITGRRAIRQRSEQLQRGARREFRGVDKPPYTVDTVTDPPPEVEMLHAGVRYRVIYDPAGLEMIHTLQGDIEDGLAQGEEARVLANTPTKLMIIDDRVAMIPLDPASQSLVSMIVVHPSGLLDALSSLFEDLWRRALPLRDVAGVPIDGGTSPTSTVDPAQTADPAPTIDEVRLLNLLATGMPDDAIAKQLGVSHRTVQRRIRALLDRLDARTRFQAGMQASARGWLHTP